MSLSRTFGMAEMVGLIPVNFIEIGSLDKKLSRGRGWERNKGRGR